MNEHEFEQAFKAWSRAEAAEPAAADLRARVRAVPHETPRRRPWWSSLRTWRSQTMFSATKFVVASIILAFFGSVLLAGALTRQTTDETPPVGASATAASDASPSLLPGVGLTTREVEPGVHQVLTDGAGHDLVAEPPRALRFAPDGDLVLFSGPQEEENVLLGGWALDHFYALGQVGEQALDGTVDAFWFDAAFDGDGNLVVGLWNGPDPNRLALFDGQAWSSLTWPNGTTKVNAIELAPDGTVYVTKGNNGSGPRVARVEDGELSVLPVLDDGSRALHTGSDIAFAPDGTLWVANNNLASPVTAEVKGLVYFDGETWREPELPTTAESRIDQFGPLAIGPDGTLWVYVTDVARGQGSHTLWRLRDGEWSAFTGSDGPPRMWVGQGWVARVAVDADGTLWIALVGDPPDGLPPSLEPSAWPHGVLSFDGSTWRQYLAGRRVTDLAVDEGGSVWAASLAHCADVRGRECREAVDGGLFVITPEATTAPE